MRLYAYSYETIIRFNVSVSRHNFKLRCIPCENLCQNIIYNKLHLLPYNNLKYDYDTFGNKIQYGEKMDAHDLFVFISCGEVELSRYCIMDSKPDTIYRLPSSLTGATAEMIDYLKKKNFDSDSPLYIAEFLMHQMYEKMEYRKGATNVSTSAREAFESGKGVCQDFAHILIAMCRQCGIFARYVNGFMAGEGETHAWVEIWDNGFWYGFDPTNNCRIDYGYIKLAHGRDAADCPVNRGIFTGNAIQHSEIRVRVEERPLYQL